MSELVKCQDCGWWLYKMRYCYACRKDVCYRCRAHHDDQRDDDERCPRREDY